MKYTLKQKFHPNQVEEIGHVFEEDYTFGFSYRTTGGTKYAPRNEWVYPHEIALLCEAGYLVKEEELLEVVVKSWNKQANEIVFGNTENYTDPQLELWTEEPGNGKLFWYLLAINGGRDIIVKGEKWLGYMSDKLILSTKNCHRTQKSAEEALKQIKEKYNI